MIAYGRGCAGCQTLPRTIQPLKAKELPEGTEHGNWAAYGLYGCRCKVCQEWALQNGKGGKPKRGAVAHARKTTDDSQRVRPVRIKKEGSPRSKGAAPELRPGIWQGRSIPMRHCKCCGKEFRPSGTNQRYCTSACRMQMHRKRKEQG